MRKMSADRHTKLYGSKKEILILQYNLNGKVQKQYQDMCQEGDNNLFRYFLTEYYYDLDPPDAGVGKKIKYWFRVYRYELLWGSGKFV